MKLNKYIYLLGLTIASFSWNGCNVFDEEEPIPSYLYIDSMQMNVNYIVEGSEIHDIKDAWVSVNDEFIGVFPVPAIIPVLETGVQDVRIFPGISRSGVSNYRIVNPMYTFYENSVELASGRVDTIKPIIAYHEDNVFLLVEDFETSNLMTFDIDGSTETKVKVEANDVFEGSKSGEIELTTSNRFVEVGSNLTYQIPDPEHVYLEIHYKNEVDIEFGLISYKDNDPLEKEYITGVFASDEWRKIYIDITNDVRLLQTNGGNEFRFVIRGLNTKDDDNAYIYLDNIKLIYQ